MKIITRRFVSNAFAPATIALLPSVLLPDGECTAPGYCASLMEGRWENAAYDWVLENSEPVNDAALVRMVREDLPHLTLAPASPE